MGGGLLNLVAVGELNVILNGNPSKRFFKSTYAKYTNFGLQRFELNYTHLNRLSLFEDSSFEFDIPYNGDLLLDAVFAINIPDIYSPIYCMPLEKDSSKTHSTRKNYRSLSELYCQPYEFRWVEDLGTNLVKKVKYCIDGRVIQEFSGDYLLCRSERDLADGKKEIFNEMIGNVPSINKPEDAYTNNGNYPNVTWNINITDQNLLDEASKWRGRSRGGTGSETAREAAEGLEPSIRGRIIYVPINIWHTSSSYLSLPLCALYYSKLSIIVECRPLSELIVVRDLDYFERFVNNCCSKTGIITSFDKNGLTPANVFKYYNPPFIRPNFNDERYNWSFFLETPPLRVNGVKLTSEYTQSTGIPSLEMQGNACIGEFIYDKNVFRSKQDAFKKMRELFYVGRSLNWNQNIHLVVTNVFLGEEEQREFVGLPQKYLVRQVQEKTVPYAVGTNRELVVNNNVVASWMWFFRRSDVVLRNQWSNYTNWPYKHMPYPCILTLDLRASLYTLEDTQAPYITPCKALCPRQFNICSMYIGGPVHPENRKNIMIDWALYCDGVQREESMPVGINLYLEHYIKTPGNSKEGLYSYNFWIDHELNSIQPRGAFNLRKFSEVVFEYTTIQPFRELNPTAPLSRDFVNDINKDTITAGDVFPVPDVCNTRSSYQSKGWPGDSAQLQPGGAVFGFNNPTFTDGDYTFDMHIMQECYNVLVFSGGMAFYAFPL